MPLMHLGRGREPLPLFIALNIARIWEIAWKPRERACKEGFGNCAECRKECKSNANRQRAKGQQTFVFTVLPRFAKENREQIDRASSQATIHRSKRQGEEQVYMMCALRMSYECPARNVRLHETLVFMGFLVGQMSDECQEGKLSRKQGSRGGTKGKAIMMSKYLSLGWVEDTVLVISIWSTLTRL